MSRMVGRMERWGMWSSGRRVLMNPVGSGRKMGTTGRVRFSVEPSDSKLGLELGLRFAVLGSGSGELRWTEAGGVGGNEMDRLRLTRWVELDSPSTWISISEVDGSLDDGVGVGRRLGVG